jgi:hypothetical protein
MFIGCLSAAVETDRPVKMPYLLPYRFSPQCTAAFVRDYSPANLNPANLNKVNNGKSLNPINVEEVGHRVK